MQLPRHIGLIIDGNRRWVRQEGLASPSDGHRYVLRLQQRWPGHSADISFVKPVREGDVLVATAIERTHYERSGIDDVTCAATTRSWPNSAAATALSADRGGPLTWFWQADGQV